MNLLLLNQRTLKLQQFDPEKLTLFASQVRALGGKFRTTLWPHKGVATLNFSTLPSVSLTEMLQQIDCRDRTAPSVRQIQTGTNLAISLPASDSPDFCNSDAVDEIASESTDGIARTSEEIASSSENSDLSEAIASPEATQASLEELLAQTKTKLRKLAQQYKIPGRSGMTHEQKAEALVGIALTSDLRSS